MLQTCTRCRTRRSKCDTRLPACTNCAKADLECTFHDDALGIDIPRSYVQSLHERIHELTTQVTRRQHSHAGTFFSTAAHDKLFHVTLPRRGQDSYLVSSPAAYLARTTVEALSHGKASVDVPAVAYAEHAAPDVAPADRALLTPSTIRFLLGQFDRCIRAHYDILHDDMYAYDGNNLKKLPGAHQFMVLMACAVAAAREAYTAPLWTAVATVCRDWADDLVLTLVSAADDKSMTAILLLLIYELAESSRGLVWELHDLAVRTCLQLGWHRLERNMLGPDEQRLLAILKDIEVNLRSIFNRPTTRSDAAFAATSETEIAMSCHAQLLREPDMQACPFMDPMAQTMTQLEGLHEQQPAIWQAWLLFAPVCVKHRQCVFCFQEADEENARGMVTLRKSVLAAAIKLLDDVYRLATSKDGFIPPLVASFRAITAGCTIVVSISKRWTPEQSHISNLIKCTDILSMFAPHWKGGNSYVMVWRNILQLLDGAQAQPT